MSGAGEYLIEINYDLPKLRYILNFFCIYSCSEEGFDNAIPDVRCHLPYNRFSERIIIKRARISHEYRYYFHISHAPIINLATAKIMSIGLKLHGEKPWKAYFYM